VIEFDSKEALDSYAKTPAHDEWMKVYSTAHEASTTHDITN
jgi:hypothetical protein